MNNVAALLAVACGGGLGAACRYGVELWLSAAWQAPLGTVTLVVNVTGSFLIGLVMAVFQEWWEPGALVRRLVTTGFLGGYTTFSALSYEVLVLSRAGRPPAALGLLAANVVLGIGSAWLGNRTVIGLRALL